MVLLLTALAFGQAYESNPCTGGKAELKQEVMGDQISLLGELTGPAWGAGISSSHLAASGTAPVVPPEPWSQTDEGLDAYLEKLEAYDRWTCTYAGVRAIDGDPRTAWVEGADGVGEGEVLFVALPEGPGAAIWAGYGKSGALFKKNARPREVEVILVGAGDMNATQMGVMYADNPILARHTVTLDDVNDYQALPLPPVPEGEEAAFLGIRIVSAYPGEKWQDTCISEIKASM